MNGEIIDSPALNVTSADIITVNGTPLPAREPARLWRYNKPRGLVVTARDEKDRQTIFDTLPPSLPRVLSVGRLDMDSEGLLLLTNDGGLARHLELPSTGWSRKYRVRVQGQVDPDALASLANGITIDGIRYGDIHARLDRQMASNAWLQVAIREGKNREVRRIMEHLGHQVSRLIRISYGPFMLGDLGAGAVEEIRPRVLADQLGLKPEDGAADRVALPNRTSRLHAALARRNPANPAHVRATGQNQPQLPAGTDRMRIIAGRHRGTKLTELVGASTRPTADRVRENLFNILAGGRYGEVIAGATIIDGFAGTGAPGGWRHYHEGPVSAVYWKEIRLR